MSDARKWGASVLIWLLLLAMPWWLPAMSLNFLLGFTGVLSFGHAAYFGLGAYGAGMVLKFLLPSTLLGILVGVAVGTVAAAIIGAMIVRLRGVYFAMVTIAFGQVFYFIAFRWNSVTGGDDGLTGWKRQPIDLGFAQLDIDNDRVFFYLVLALFAAAVGIMALLLRSPFGRTLLAIRENERRARYLGIPVERHIWLSASPGRSMRCSTTSPIPGRCAGTCRATSSSWRCWAACARSGGR